MLSVPQQRSIVQAAISGALTNPEFLTQAANTAIKLASNSIRSVAKRTPNGAIMPRALARAGFPMPKTRSPMLVTDSVRDVNNASSTPNIVRSPNAAYPIGYSGKSSKRNRRSRNSRVPRGISDYVDVVPTCFRASALIINNAANSTALAIQLAASTSYTTTSFSFPISAIVAQWNSLANLYREFRIKKITVDWVPRVGSTSAGDCAACIDRDPRAGTTTQSSIVRKNPFFQTDYKLPACLEWTPVDSRDREWRYTVPGTPTRPEETLSFGALLFTSTNDQAINAPIGDLFINIWADWAVPF